MESWSVGFSVPPKYSIIPIFDLPLPFPGGKNIRFRSPSNLAGGYQCRLYPVNYYTGNLRRPVVNLTRLGVGITV